MARQTDIIGLDDLERSFRELGKVPQTVATQSARAGATVARREARKNAPVDEGDLQKGIIIKRSRNRSIEKGSAIFNVMMDPAKSSLFVKVSKEGKRSYYPASQEYGFFARDGRYIPGYGYLRRSVDENEREIERKVLERAEKAIDRAMRKK